MGNIFKTDQEDFWAGKFGDEYIARNAGDALVGSNTSLLRAENIFTTKNLRVVRHANGPHPKYRGQLLGCRVSQDARIGTLMSWDPLW